MSSLSPRRQSRGRYQKSIVGKTCEKGRFWDESEKEKELRRVEINNYDDAHELPWMKCGECEGDWWHETGQWYKKALKSHQYSLLLHFLQTLTDFHNIWPIVYELICNTMITHYFERILAKNTLKYLNKFQL